MDGHGRPCPGTGMADHGRSWQAMNRFDPRALEGSKRIGGNREAKTRGSQPVSFLHLGKMRDEHRQGCGDEEVRGAIRGGRRRRRVGGRGHVGAGRRRRVGGGAGRRGRAGCRGGRTAGGGGDECRRRETGGGAIRPGDVDVRHASLILVL